LMIIFVPLRDRHRILGGIVGIVLLGILIYSSTLQAPFIFDDRHVITENQATKSLPLALQNVSSNRYVGYLSFALNYSYGRLDVRGYHITNIAIHIANAILLYVLLQLLFCTPGLQMTGLSREFLVFSVPFLFLVHPLQTQAVSYISQRFASLAVFFYLASLLFYIKARLSQAGVRVEKLLTFKTAGLFSASLISALLAMKTKEIAFTIPIMVLVCEVYLFSSPDKKNTMGRLIFPALLIAVPIGLILSGVLISKRSLADMAASLDSLSRETVQISRSEYLLTQFNVVTTYLRLMILPMNQNLDYNYPVATTLLSQDMILPFGIFAFLIFLAIAAYKRARLLSFGIAWFFVALLVESSVIPIRDVINEHRMYLPSIGLCMASMAAVDRVVQHQRAKTGLVVMVVLFLAVGTISRNRVWQAPDTLWSDVISKAPNNARAYNTLGIVYKERKQYEKADELFQRALRADKNYTAVYYNLGDVQYGLGNYEKALEYLDTAMKGTKDSLLHADILNKIGRTYGAMGRREQAIDSFKKAIAIYPLSPVFRNNLAVQYIKAGSLDEAIATLEKALGHAPSEDYLYLNLANAYAGKGDETKKALMFEKAQEIRRAKQP
ncbi:MAG: tetratricopeptide repeat protein, partial [Nitrospirota bacterium]|nr:tetratricopeptide repeat protein [Nitrospirota bacterium]